MTVYIIISGSKNIFFALERNGNVYWNQGSKRIRITINGSKKIFGLEEKNFWTRRKKFDLYRLRCPSSYKIFFGFILVKNHFGHESRDDYVTVDNIEFNQNTLSNSAPTHTIGPMKYK
jgi:hypothetical protein